MKFKQSNKKQKIIYKVGVGKFSVPSKITFYQVLNIRGVGNKPNEADLKSMKNVYNTRKEAETKKKQILRQLVKKHPSSDIYEVGYTDFTKK